MIALVFTSALLVVVNDPCAGSFDRTEACASPAQAAATIPADGKPEPEKPARDPLVIPQQLGFFAFGTALLGTGALAATALDGANVPRLEESRTALRIGGIGLLVASGAIVAASGALLVFDPSTGKMRFDIEDGG